jgi:hypothetical protein
VLTLFVLAWAVGVLSWLLALAESIGVWRFMPLAYRIGRRVLRETVALPRPFITPSSDAFETENGKFKLVSPTLLLFRRKARLLSFQVHTPFPIKGAIRWEGETARVEGRVSLFATIFFGAWAVAWTVGGLALWLLGEPVLLAFGLLLVGWGFAGGMYVFSVRFELRRARAILGELKLW